MRLTVDVIKDDTNWNKVKIPKRYINRVVKTTLEDSGRIYPTNLELSFLLSNNQKLQELNKNFRNKNNPTNVLSFPDIDYNNIATLEKILKENYLYLGDIAFAYETIMIEAKTQGKPFFNHMIHLMVHSILHLLGYDHICEQEAKIMEDIEILVLEKFSIPNPYYI